ncbi:hypothetical protein WMY93_030532 [Mugilogobius chulae]|uniref:TRIM8/14/16/25/29/45/65 coiled-coil region domain-containing protein n=1 Tax=Mugilogobius chulae TaxID=88201 RepID=A0AAW0MPQ5_9GOBI
MEDATSRNMKEIRSHIEQSKKKKDVDVADVEKVFALLVNSLKRDKLRLVQIIEQKYKDALREPENRVCQLQKRIIEIQKKRAQLEEAAQIDDHLRLLQRKVELPEPHHEDLLSQFDLDDEEPYSGIVKSAMEEMEDILGEEMDKLIQRVQDPYNRDNFVNALQIWVPPKDELQMIQQNDAVDLTLDPYSAHSQMGFPLDDFIMKLMLVMQMDGF